VQYDRQIDRHDLVRRHAQHIHNLGAVEHGRRAAFVHLRGQFLHDRLGEIPERHRRQIREAEVQNFRRETEQAPFGFDITERLQGQQDAARAGAREAGRGGDVGERLFGALRVERANHRAAARERLHIGVARFVRGRFGAGGNVGGRRQGFAHGPGRMRSKGSGTAGVE
jgi:hypothetical protein